MNATSNGRNGKGGAAHASAPAASAGGLSPLAQMSAALSGAFYERGEAIGALLGAVVAGQHAILLGPPGTAKSDLARTLASALGGLRFWEGLLTRFSTPEDVFGPVKLSGLQADRYERATAGTAVEAEIVFLDECFKANAAILNSLLGILNERAFSNGPTRIPVPLVSAIGASNELPESAEELGALWDRFLVRLHVGYLADRSSFDALMFGARPRVPVFPVDVRAEQAAAALVTFAADLPDALWSVREACKRDGIAVSDRRWRQCLSLVRATAHLDGRTVADPDDLGCLEHVLWGEPDQRPAVARLVQGIVNPNAARAVAYLDDARACVAALPPDGGGKKTADVAACAEAITTLGEITAKLAALGSGRKVDGARAEVDRLAGQVRARVSRAMGLAL